MRLWDYPGDITQRMNEDKLRELCEYICLTTPTKALDSVMEVVMNSQPLGLKISIEEPNIQRKIRQKGPKETM